MLIPTGRRARPAPAASQRPVLTSPPPAIRRQGPLNEASTRVQAMQPSGLPLAWRPRTERGTPWAFPRASHPADQEPTTHVEVGTGHRTRTWNYTLNITSVDPPIVRSLTMCDLASHRLKAVTPVVLLVRGKSDSPTEAGARATLENSARHAVGCCKIDSLREPPIGTMSVALSPGQSSTVTCVGGSVVTIAAQRRSESTRNLGSHPAGACCAQGTRDVTVRPR